MPEYLGAQAERLRAVESAGTRIAALAGYREVRRAARIAGLAGRAANSAHGRACQRSPGAPQARLPLLEHAEVFEKPLGPTSDVVAKEMYTFTPDGSSDRITLRPEGTAGACVKSSCPPPLPESRSR